MPLEFEEPESFKIGDVEYEIIPLPVDEMKLALDFIELTGKLSETREKAKAKATPKKGQRTTPKKTTKQLIDDGLKTNKIIFDEIMPLAQKIVNMGIRLKEDPEAKVELPREQQSVVKLLRIASLVIRATTDIDMEVDINLQMPKKQPKKS